MKKKRLIEQIYEHCVSTGLIDLSDVKDEDKRRCYAGFLGIAYSVIETISQAELESQAGFATMRRLITEIKTIADEEEAKAKEESSR